MKLSWLEFSKSSDFKNSFSLRYTGYFSHRNDCQDTRGKKCLSFKARRIKRKKERSSFIQWFWISFVNVFPIFLLFQLWKAQYQKSKLDAEHFFSQCLRHEYTNCATEISWAPMRSIPWKLPGCSRKSIIYSRVSVLSSFLVYYQGSAWSLLVVIKSVLMISVILSFLSTENICSIDNLVQRPWDKWGGSLRSQVRTNSHPCWARAAGNGLLPPTDTSLVVLLSLSAVGPGALFQAFREGKRRRQDGEVPKCKHCAWCWAPAWPLFAE